MKKAELELELEVEAYSAMYKEAEEKDEAVMNKLRSAIPEDFVDEILSEIEESEGGFEFAITDDYGNGDYEERDGYEYIKGIYIEQWVGYAGDDYSGYIWIKISDEGDPEQYFKFSYSM